MLVPVQRDIGLRMATDMFRLAGWRCLFLGANVPVSEIANAAVSQNVDLVVSIATLTTQLKELESAIAALRAAGGSVQLQTDAEPPEKRVKRRRPCLQGGLGSSGIEIVERNQIEGCATANGVARSSRVNAAIR